MGSKHCGDKSGDEPKVKKDKVNVEKFQLRKNNLRGGIKWIKVIGGTLASIVFLS